MVLHVNGKEEVLHGQVTLAVLLHHLRLPPDRPGMAIAVNDEVITRDRWESTNLEDGARIEIIQAVSGG